MTELKYDPRNYRIHTDKNKRLIKKSLEDCGTGRSILLDKNDVIIAGNGVYEQALELFLINRLYLPSCMRTYSAISTKNNIGPRNERSR